jgi:hypothetical protein
MKDQKQKSQVKRTIKASSIQSVNPEPTKENRDIINQSTKWVPFFKDTKNLYVNDLALRYRRSATTASLINASVNYTIGNGFAYEVNDNPIEREKLDKNLLEFLDEANLDMQTLEDVYRDIVFNWKTFGNVYLEISRAKVRGKDKMMSNIVVHDATKVRIDKRKTVCFISSFWREIQNSHSSGQYPTPEQVELWNKKKDTNQQRFIIHLKRKVPEYDFYGLPDYIATLKDADIEYQVDTYNLERLENGFFPSVLVSLFGDPPEGMSDKAYIDAIVEKYSGSDNAGKLLVQLLDDASQGAQVQEFSGAKEGEFQSLEDSAKKGMMQGHRMHPMLADIETTGKLGSSTEVVNHWRKYMETVCVPEYQNPTLRLLNLVLEMIGFDVKVSIINKAPIGIGDQIEPQYLLTVNEQRKELGFEELEELQDKYSIKISGGSGIATLEDAENVVKQDLETEEEVEPKEENNGSDDGDSDGSGSGE